MNYEADLDEEMRKPWLTPDELKLATDPHEGEFLAWLLPLAMTFLSVAVIWACKHFGWLQ